MAYEIISKEDVSRMIRMPISKIDDFWYEIVLSEIELQTGLYSLSEAQDIVQTLDGDGSYTLSGLYKPINSVSSLSIDGASVPSNYFLVRWNEVSLRTFYNVNLVYEANLRYTQEFASGIGNISISYNAGGTANLPSHYLGALKMCIVLCLQALSTMPREEGTDQVLRNYKSINEEYARKDEVASEYGVHGKIKSIIKNTLPKRTVFK